MKILDHISRVRDLHIEGYAIFFFILSLRFVWMIPCWIIYLFLLRRKLKWKLLWVLCSIILIQFVLINYREIPKTIQNQVYVKEVIKTESYDIVVIKHRLMKFRFYTSNYQFHKNDLIFIQGDVSSYRGQTIFFGFNPKHYFLSQGIVGEIETHQIELIQEGFNINLKDYINHRIEGLSSKDYIKTYLYGEKSISIEEQTTYQSLGILFLFSVSGLHFYVLTSIIKKLMFQFNLSQKHQKTIILFIYLWFIYLYDFSMTILRITLMYIFHWVNERFYFKLTHLDLIQCVFLCLIVFNPYFIYHQGLLMVYLILNFLVLLKPMLHGENWWIKQLKVNGIIQIILIPFKAINYFIVLVFMPLIVIFLSGPAFLLAWVTLLIPRFDGFYSQMMLIFFKVIQDVSVYGIQFFLPALPSFSIFLYFVNIFLIFYTSSHKRKLIHILIIFLLFFVQIVKPYESSVKVMMLDVGQGDTFYFESRDCKMMIDSYQGSLEFLQNRGIYHLDYLFLTHSDTDHIKEAVKITQYLDVEQVGISIFDIYPELYGKLLPLHFGKSITCGNFNIDVLGPIKHYQNPNDNSLVLKIKILEKTFLFTGDIEQEAEQDLINMYGYNLASDVLKVAHHGSITSTSNGFLKLVNPKVAWISAGYENRFGFPSQEIIHRLIIHEVNIYRTDLDGTVVLKYHEKKRKWTLHLPFKDDF
ncbi:MAG: ComEC/Rec2 family competence protein [Acholeplasmataceae bacterium]